MSGFFPVSGFGFGDITSGFGNRSSPGGIGSTNHKGIDIGAPIGSTVIAPVGGTVLYSGQAGGYGNYVKMQGNDGLIYEFGHLSKLGVAAGQSIAAGAPIAQSGNTGNSTGPHLHFGVKDKFGKYLDPKSILADGRNALEKAYDTTSKAIKDSINTVETVAGEAVFKGMDTVVPGSGTILKNAGQSLGLGGVFGGKSWLDNLKDWIIGSGFFQRLTLAILAFIILFAALYLMKDNMIEKVTEKLK